MRNRRVVRDSNPQQPVVKLGLSIELTGTPALPLEPMCETAAGKPSSGAENVAGRELQRALAKKGQRAGKKVQAFSKSG
jgi:hypothetical protein